MTACAALTRADVEKALGVRVGKGEAQKDGASSTCDYEGEDGQVSVTVQRIDKALDIRSEIESLKASVPGSSVREAEGIGALAFFLDIPEGGTQLFVIRENDFVMISLLGFGAPEKVSPAAREMAQKVFGRL